MSRFTDELRKRGRIQVRERLTPTQYAAVQNGLAFQRCYQDQPADVPYPFRPIKYFLVATDRLLRRRQG